MQKRIWISLSSFSITFPNYSTRPLDSLLITDAYNLEASWFWEGLIHVTVKDVSLCFLFDKERILYHGEGFEILMVLNQHCCPDTVANAFMTLMSLFNDIKSKAEPIMKFCSWVDSMVMDMLHCKIMIAPILLVMFFLCALHGHYTDLLEQFHSHSKVLEDASIVSVVEDVHYHNSFTLASLKKSPHPPGSWGPKASAAIINKQGTVWANPFEWLSKYGRKGIKTCWIHALVSTGICPICHCAKNPWHVPANCPPLKDLKLKLVKGPPSAPSPAPALASPAPAPAPSSGGSVTLASGPPNDSTSSNSTPSGLMALLAKKYDRLAKEYESDKDFCWVGDKDCVVYDASSATSCKCNNSVAFYPSCNHPAAKLIAHQIRHLPFLFLWLWLCPVSFSPNTCRLSLLGCQRILSQLIWVTVSLLRMQV
jgi:hypothetical protein